MDKHTFLAQLRNALSALPQQEAEERISFYNEMIDDFMEEGLSEEEAVSRIGSAESISAQILGEASSAKETKQKRKFKAWEIVLLIVGSPLWFSLGIAAVSIAFSLYVSVWAVIVSLWAVFGALAASGFGCVIGGAILALNGQSWQGVSLIGAGLVCAGLSVFFFYGCKAITKGTVWLTKRCFTKKEGAQ